MLITSLQIKESSLRKLRCWFQVTQWSTDLKKPNSELFSLCFDWLTSQYSVPGNAGHDWFVCLSTHPSIHVYIIYLSIIYSFIHTCIYPSMSFYLSMHLSFIYIMYPLSMYLSSSHLSIHVSIIYQLSFNSFIYLSKHLSTYVFIIYHLYTYYPSIPPSICCIC